MNMVQIILLMNYLGCTIIDNERDITKNFVKAAEKCTQNTFQRKCR